jgi:hypothetical protein
VRSKYEVLHLIIDCYTQQADLSDKTIKAKINKVAVLDRKANVLAGG